MNRVGILLIATGKYDVFLKPLLDSIHKYFFQNENIDVYIFSDKDAEPPKKPFDFNYKRLSINYYYIPHRPFPYATLYRYSYFSLFGFFMRNIGSEYLFYMDVDMILKNKVGEEILGEIVCVQHPGFYKGGWGSDGCDPRSNAFLPKELCYDYKAGGFQGGKIDNYLKACDLLITRIKEDEENGVMAIWHDETHWNWYLKTMVKNVKTLDCSYCYPEARWFNGAGFTPRIVALEKNHAEIRS